MDNKKAFTGKLCMAWILLTHWLFTLGNSQRQNIDALACNLGIRSASAALNIYKQESTSSNVSDKCSSTAGCKSRNWNIDEICRTPRAWFKFKSIILSGCSTSDIDNFKSAGLMSCKQKRVRFNLPYNWRWKDEWGERCLKYL